MRQNGEEYQFGWRKEIAVSGVTVSVGAFHSRRSRLPRGHEMARQMSRGRPMEMVQEVDFEWRLQAPGIGRATIRQNPNGSFSVDGRHAGRAASVVEAATAWAEARLPKDVPEENPVPAPR